MSKDFEHWLMESCLAEYKEVKHFGNEFRGYDVSNFRDAFGRYLNDEKEE